MQNNRLIESVNTFPTCSGVYIMKDQEDHYLYIGKAKNIRSRVKSYFLDKNDGRYQIPYLMKKVAAIDWIATNSETEALILESNLIKTHKPPYNADLKDDKHFPYLKITTNEPFPRLIVSRKLLNDGATYFGPYTDAGAMRRNMDFAKKIFKLRNCKKKLPQKYLSRPCINHAIGNCSGPCAGLISQKEYGQQVDLLLQFLKGQSREIITLFEKRMALASKKLQYETAASLRDQITLIKKATNTQRVDLRTPHTACDVFGIYQSDFTTCLCILSFRQGLLLSRRHFLFKRTTWDTPFAEHENIVLRYYQSSLSEIPKEIIVPEKHYFNTALLKEWFLLHYKKSVNIIKPQRGFKRDLIALAEKNARLYIVQKAPTQPDAIAQELKKALNLPRLPHTIEAFDISNLRDDSCVAGMVRFTHGKPDKNNYRRFKIKTVSGQNDFAMMMEAVSRRLSRLEKESKPFPDLLLIDGGKGQLSAAAKALEPFSSPPMLCSIAKKEEIIFSAYTSTPTRLNQRHPARKMIERIRNEVHRWAITYHRTVRSKKMSHSSLERIPGIGPKKAQMLLKALGSIKKIKESPLDKLTEIPGVTTELAERIHQTLIKAKK